MSAIVRAISTAFNTNTRGIGLFSARLYNAQFSSCTPLFFARFIVSPIRFVRKGPPLRFPQSDLEESMEKTRFSYMSVFF